MGAAPKILAFAGSARKDSFNRKLIQLAARLAEEAGGEVTLVELRDYPMPLYDGDLEAAEGVPATARALKGLLLGCQGLLIAAPEYNSSLTPLLKNTLDWMSRRESDDEPPLAAYRGLVAGLCSASPGMLGGLRGLVVLRMMLGNIGVHVVPEQLAVRQAGSAFEEDGTLAGEAQMRQLRGMAQSLVDTARAIGRKTET